MNKPDEETIKSTYGLMCAKLAMQYGWSLDEVIQLIRIGYKAASPTNHRVAP